MYIYMNAHIYPSVYFLSQTLLVFLHSHGINYSRPQQGGKWLAPKLKQQHVDPLIMSVLRP